MNAVKSFNISKELVVQAYRAVKANAGSADIDEQSIKNFENRYLFRKGEVSGWRNYLSPVQVERLSALVDDKLGGSGLTFRYC